MPPAVIFYGVMAFLCAAYFVSLCVFSPGTFLGTVTGFSMVWLLFSFLFVALIFARKHGIWTRIGKKIKIAICASICIACAVLAVNIVFIRLPKIASGNENVKYVIVLGGGITKDAKLSRNVKNRVELAADYMKKNTRTIAVVTGGKLSFLPCPESTVLKSYLVELGIPEERVLEEDSAKDTIQNFQLSAKVLADHEKKSIEEITASPVMIITSDIHLARAERLAKRIGYSEFYGLASKTPLLYAPHGYLREACAYIKINLRIFFTGNPKPIHSSL